MGWKATVRAMEAAQRRQQRESQRRQRELEQRAKEQAKLSAIEQARLEVETFENRLDGLLSIHKEQSEVLDWEEFATSLPPPPPQRKSYYELQIKQRVMVWSLDMMRQVRLSSLHAINRASWLNKVRLQLVITSKITDRKPQSDL